MLVTKYLRAFSPLPGRAGCGPAGKGLSAGWPCHLCPRGPPTLLRVWWGLREAHRRDRRERTGATICPVIFSFLNTHPPGAERWVRPSPLGEEIKSGRHFAH